MSIKIIIAETMNGRTPIDNLPIDVPDIPAATNRFNPTGGVNNPIAKLTVMKTPKTVGSTSMTSMIGKRIGTKI